MKQPAVSLAPNWRPIIGRAFRNKLLELQAQLLCVSMSSTHAHMLAKMPPGPVPRLWVGRAKMHSNFFGKDHGWTGKLRAVRCKVIPIKDRQHQLHTLQYILDHIDEGAWVWDFRDGADHAGRRNDESPGTAVPGFS